MPTILEIAQVPAQDLELQGRSLISLFENPSAPWRDFGFARNKRNLARLTDLELDERVAREGCWKLHHYLYKGGYELYDVCADPLETRNLAGQELATVSRLSFELVRNLETSRPHGPGLPSANLKQRARAFVQSLSPPPAEAAGKASSAVSSR
jgi:hypothetical protein